MSFGFGAGISVDPLNWAGVIPQAPGAGRTHPFELRAGAWYQGELKVVRLRGRERMNDVYRYDVTFLTDQPPELVTSAVFGAPACLTIKSPGTDARVIQGIASSVKALGGVPGEQGSRVRRYALTIVPRLWLLRHRRQNRIFQNKTIQEVITKVLAGAGIKDSDVRWRTTRNAYPKLPFLYQRGETDWDFFRRVLASSGVFFFYEHANGFLDSMFGGAASAVAGAVGAAAGMIGGALGSAVSMVEKTTGMVPVLNFGDEAGHTAAVAPSLSGVADEALQAGLGALAGAVAGVGGQVIGAVASAVEEPSDTLAFDDDLGSNAHVERVYKFELEKSLRTKEIRVLDRDVEKAESWVGVASVGAASASLNVSAGLSLAAGLSGGGLAGGLSAGVGMGASFDVDAPAIPTSDLRQEVYQVDHNVWQDTRPRALGPWVSLSAGQVNAGLELAPDKVGNALLNFDFDGAKGRRMRIELERTRRKYQEGAGKSDCRRMGAGYRFTLGAHPIKMVNREYTITSLDVEGIHPDFLADGEAVYRNRFRCIPSNVAARPKRPKRRPKPGMEVARVVDYSDGKDVALEANPAGYVRVRFRWDILDDTDATPNGVLRIGSAYNDVPHDDPYSVWLPVVQPWAGAGYGAQFIPREGMEVLVGFLEDQSERPVILGCVYSDANPPPWPRHDDHQKVGIKSRTRPFDHGYSEISVDDRQGGELVKVRAQRDLDIEVLRDSRTQVDRHEYTTVRGNQHEHVLENANYTVKKDFTSTVEHDRISEVRGDSTHTVLGDQTTTIQGSVASRINKDLSFTVSGCVEEVTQGQHRARFEADFVERHAGHRLVMVGADNAKRSAALHVEGAARAYASTAMEAVAVEGLTLTCGKSQIRMTPQAITFSSPKIALASGSVEIAATQIAVAANGALALGGSKVTVASSGASVALDSNATIQGTTVKLGGGSGASAQAAKAKSIVTTLTLVDQEGSPVPDQRALLRKGGDGGEERMVVLDAQGTIAITGEDPFDVLFPDLPDAGKGAVSPPSKKPGGPKPLVIAQGDHLSKLATRYGFDADAVWNDPKNAEIKQKRSNPNMLVPGDVLFVPENKPNWVAAALGGTNAFVATVPRVPVHATFTKDGKPMANEPYHLQGLKAKPGDPDPPTTDGQGSIHLQVPITTTSFGVYFERLNEVHTVRVGHLDPPDEPSGARTRLGLLGLLGRRGGGLRQVQGPQDELPAALKVFQRMHELKPTGELDADTVAKLKELFGS